MQKAAAGKKVMNKRVKHEIYNPSFTLLVMLIIKKMQNQMNINEQAIISKGNNLMNLYHLKNGLQTSSEAHFMEFNSPMQH